jgi:ABC-2 type transport system ATP-binding protein
VTRDGAAIATAALSKRFGDVLALDRLTFSVPPGSVFGFLGPNGAGKTTTVRLLVGLARPTAGSATVAGLDATSGGRGLAARIGYLDQDPRFYGWMTGRELLELVARLHGLAGSALGRRVGEVLELVGLEDAARRRIGGYSGGMRQRLGIGQAMLNRPAVLFLDEPVSSLDPEGRRDVLEIVERLRGVATVLLSTHILSDVERVCDRVAILDHGRLVTEAQIDELLERHAAPVLELDPEPGQDGPVRLLVDRLRAAPWAREVRAEHGLIRVVSTDPARAAAEILPLVAAAGVVLARFERVRPSLEDVFLRLVGAEGAGPAIAPETVATDGPASTTPTGTGTHAAPPPGARP